MHRLFVAIELPVAVRDRLLAAMGGVSGARWQRDDQLHLTLRFIGEIDRHIAQDIAAALGGVHAAPFELALSGAGVFDRRGVPETLWAGVTPHDAVTALHAKVDQALRRVGMALEARAYAPHITLARFGRHSGPVGEFVTATVLGGPPFTVSGFALYESTLMRDGADYRTVERYSLQG
jgi:2'-5' RNA ligase